MENKKVSKQIVINSLIERFEDLEEETGANFIHAKRIILRWAKKHKIFDLEND